MVLVDTSVWVYHLRSGDAHLKTLLNNSDVLMHPYIMGELACGNIKNRAELIHLFHSLPQVSVASHEEVLHFIEQYHLMGQGLGYVDVHLLASVKLSQSVIWTRDKQLNSAAEKLKVCFNPVEK